MIVCRGRPWAIATFVLVASVSGSVEFSKPPAIPKLSSHLTRPVMTRSIGRLLEELTSRYSAFPNRVGDIYRSSTLRRNFVPSRNYLVYPGNHERLASRNSPEQSRAIRYRRYVVLSHLPNASDSATIDWPGNASKASQNGTVTRIPLYNAHRYFIRDIPQATGVAHREGPISSFQTDDDRAKETRTLASSSRRRRSPTTTVDDQPWRRNASDYYAERRAVMARFYARQREIGARHGTNSTSKPDDAAAPRNESVTSDVTLFRLYPSRNSSLTDNRATFRHPTITIDPVYSNLPTKLDRRPVVQEADRRFQSRSWNNSNVEGQVARYYTTPVPCANASLSGTLAPKKRSKTVDSDEQYVQTIGRTRNDSKGSDHEIWGKCRGKVVYQHNLLLGLKGPSTLDTMFEVIIQGPVCITCVEALRYNKTSAKVTFESGGEGYDYVKLKLQGYENEGFSYIIKVWGIKKFGSVCSNI